MTHKPTVVRKEAITLQTKGTEETSNNTNTITTTGGPTTTVFVGNISEKASDMLVRQLLSVSVLSLCIRLYSLTALVTTARRGELTEMTDRTFYVLSSQKCGLVLSWKRVQGASGKLQGKNKTGKTISDIFTTPPHHYNSSILQMAPPQWCLYTQADAAC